MKRAHSLLDRLTGGARTASSRRGAPPSVDSLIESIRDNLSCVLNSRHDMSQSAPLYGLPALTDLPLESEQFVQKLQDAVRAAIERYEPRLRAVRVTVQPREQNQRTIQFRIEAILASGDAEHRVRYETHPRGTGEFEVIG